MERDNNDPVKNSLIKRTSYLTKANYDNFPFNSMYLQKKNLDNDYFNGYT